ncbi:hypothetical protein [Paenibacillus oleatilyticus]|uniref:Uncharacterized protein n=1 Tax=Paenibacillus oleatilyticus TaxID=2594886 RepID=A0ABV4VCA6_9BACL
MGEAFEIALEVIEHGFTLVTFVSILHILFNWYESRKKRQSYERIEAKIDAIMEKEGIAWIGQPNGSHKVLTILNLLFQWFLEVIYRVGNQFERMGKKMQINKTWLVGLLGYIAFFVKQFTGYAVPDAMINGISDLVLLVIGLIPMFMNMTKKSKEVQSNGFGVKSEDNR